MVHNERNIKDTFMQKPTVSLLSDFTPNDALHAWAKTKVIEDKSKRQFQSVHNGRTLNYYFDIKLLKVPYSGK